MDAIGRKEGGRVSIDHEACVSCGHCARACPFGAVTDRSQLLDVLRLLHNDRQVAALVATEPGAWRVASALELLEDLARHDDGWTRCVASLAIAVGFAHAGQVGVAGRVLTEAADLARELGAPAVREWARNLAVRLAGPSGAQMLDVGSAAPSPRRADVTITCLGSFSVARDGVETPWRDLRPRGRSLLMLLTLLRLRGSRFS